LPSTLNQAVSSSANGQNSTGFTSSPGANTAPPTPLSAVPAIKSGSSASTEGDALRVSIEMPKTQNVIVTVYDGNGLLIRHLYQGVLDAGEHYIDWDSKDELGNAVLPGDYIVVLDLGNKKMSGVLKVLQNP
jgi:flagellar hook assembly protein FlgD